MRLLVLLLFAALIASGKVDDAMRCMGRPYTLSGKVVHGFHNGRGIGFPTANVGEIPTDLILPHKGRLRRDGESGR